MLDMRARKNVSRAVDPVARFLARIKVTPTMVTLSGFALSLTGSVLIGTGFLAAGAVILAVGALFDILDGVLARVTGQESTAGRSWTPLQTGLERWRPGPVSLSIWVIAPRRRW